MKKFLSLVFVLFLTLAAHAGIGAINPGVSTVADEGAWCWFADPRAVRMTSSVPGGAQDIDRTILGYIDRHGSIKLTQVDWKSGTTEDVLVRSYFQPDDHNNPAFIQLPDGRIMIFYSRHTDEACFYYRVSLKAGDATQLGPEYKLVTANNTTYPNPFILSDDPTHIYLCWRGIGWHPTIAQLSMPDAEGRCSFSWGPYQMVQSTGARPYAKYYSNGKDKIFLSYTTGHPDNEYPNWLYLNVFDVNTKQLKDIKGNVLSTVQNGKFNVSKTSDYATRYPNTIVDNTSTSRNWIWNMAMDEDGNPVIGMVKINQGKTDHNYYYAKWNGSAWKTAKIANGGGHFHQTSGVEMCYSGGMAIDRDDPKQVYCSVPVNGVYEIWHYTLGGNDGMTVTSSEAVTSGSDKNNVRPFVIEGTKNDGSIGGQDGSALRLVWMNGDYYYWIVNANYPLGYPTSVQTTVALPGTTGEAVPSMLSAPVPMKADEMRHFAMQAGDNFSVSVSLLMAPNNYGGVIMTGEGWSYGVDKTTLLPYVKIGDKTYYSTNKLCTSDSWQVHGATTNGTWLTPAKLGKWNVTVTYNQARNLLTIYRDGLIDQRIDLPEGTVLTPAASIGGFEGMLYMVAHSSAVMTLADIRATMAQDDHELIENGHFTATTANAAPMGWTMSNNTLGGSYHARVLDKNGNHIFYMRCDGTNSSTTSTYAYGGDNGLMLQADSAYELSFDYGCWGNYTKGQLKIQFVEIGGNGATEPLLVSTPNNVEGGASMLHYSCTVTVPHSGHYRLVWKNGTTANYAFVIDNLSLIMTDPGVLSIEKPHFTDADKADGALYNLSGQRIAAPGKGVYISQGRKHVRR